MFVALHPSCAIALLDDDAHIGSDIIVVGSVRKRLEGKRIVARGNVEIGVRNESS
jgi:hypothetical protein